MCAQEVLYMLVYCFYFHLGFSFLLLLGQDTKLERHFNGRMAMLDNSGFFSFPSSLEFNGVPCYSFQSSMRSCSPLFARRQRMVWLQNMLRVLYSTHFVGWPECIQMALAGKGGIVFKLSWLFLSISLVEKIVLYNFLKYATCFHSSKEGNDSLLSKTRKCVSDIIRVCFFEAGRSIAHKCARFLALCIRLVLIICILFFDYFCFTCIWGICMHSELNIRVCYCFIFCRRFHPSFFLH